MKEDQKIINLGIVAHVDAGKTSITEQMLVAGGLLTKPGSVDNGTSQTDWLKVEKDRGISVRTATASLLWNNTKINIIDTPGHVDFSTEVERAFPAMDCVILVISAVEGIQGHTSTLWNAILKMKIPCFIFINKIDRPGSDSQGLISEIIRDFTRNIFVINSTFNEGYNNSYIEYTLDIHDFNNIDSDSKEIIINGDDLLLEKYLSDEDITCSELKESLIHQISLCNICPVLCGSAKYGIGITELINTITSLIKTDVPDNTKKATGIVYKVEHDDKIGKIASVRLFEGIIKNRNIVKINGREEKITQIRKQQGSKFKDIGELVGGDTAAICGLTSVRAGDRIGEFDTIHENIKLVTSVLTVKVIPNSDNDYSDLVNAMQILSVEDPNLDLIWLKDERELHIKIMGIIQLQILKSIVLDRFKINIDFETPTVIYKETPSSKFIAYEEYTMPKPCWAVVRFEVEPLERGAGIQFESKVGVNKIATQYQQEVERSLTKALVQGVLGWEVTDIKITLIGDEDHNIHSRAGDFAVATAIALMKGFKKNGTTLLEPILKYSISAPEEYLGSIVGRLTQIRAEFDSPEITDDSCKINGTVPVSTSLDFPTVLASITSGKASYHTSFSGYCECTIDQGETTPYRGVNPLDRAKYILKARKALI